MAIPVELRVGGQTYRVVASASEQELLRLAQVVDSKLRELTPKGRSISAQSMLLAAMALAHELEHERARRVDVERRSRELLERVLHRIDDVLAEPDVAGFPEPAAETPSTDA